MDGGDDVNDSDDGSVVMDGDDDGNDSDDGSLPPPSITTLGNDSNDGIVL
jgi:hypothetical protein